jgi:predicted nucleic acid-binding protein
MALILDTNALSAFADGDDALRHSIRNEPALALPAIVLGEYFFGVQSSRYRLRYENWLNSYLSGFLILSAGRETARHYADIRLDLKAAGKPIPSNDLWIAAIAREHNYPIVSRDTHFAAIRSVRLITW